jgi:hypothetical protein
MISFFSGFNILKYWDILVEYVNPLMILLWGVIGCLTGNVVDG